MEAAMTGKTDNAFGMRCPKCRASDRIDIAASVWVRLCLDGSDATQAANGDHEWEPASLAVCNSCGHAATVWDFNVENQPDPSENDARAERARKTLEQYVTDKSEVFENNSSEIADLIADLLHLAIRIDQGHDPVESTLRLARMHFEAEHGEIEEGAS
jgi:hypothetical protein